eukprot:2062123-Pyramimonas_sp.AAC.1
MPEAAEEPNKTAQQAYGAPAPVGLRQEEDVDLSDLRRHPHQELHPMEYDAERLQAAAAEVPEGRGVDAINPRG